MAPSRLFSSAPIPTAPDGTMTRVRVGEPLPLDQLPVWEGFHAQPVVAVPETPSLAALLGGLNPEQLRAVTTVEGPLLILAGAGSGKTNVLTKRVAHLLHLGVAPKSILAVTFTNKAAREMKERVHRLVGDAGEDVWVSTFHSTCARVLRMEIEALGWTKRFAIYHDDDQLRIIKELVAHHGYDPAKVIPKDLLSTIDHHKNRMVGPDELLAQRRSHLNDPLLRIWRDYEERLKAADAIDFNDLIGLTVKLFQKEPDVLHRWQQRFRYVMVDEYQDTNRGQYLLIQLLASHGNLAVVGDDDQSIYSFRGADISNILSFQRDFPAATVIKLEQNYRSTKNILAVGNAVVAVNTGRMDKKLWTEADAGHKVLLIACETPMQEAERVAAGMQKLRRMGFTYGDIAIVYRTNMTSRVFEQALRTQNIPYRIVGGRKFYERREIRDVLAYLRLIVNPADDAAFLRAVSVPPRGIGPKTLQSLREEATTRGEPLLRVARGRKSASSRDGKLFGAFVDVIDELADLAKEVMPGDLVVRALDRTGYLAWVDAQGAAEKDRLDNLDELVRDAATVALPEEAQLPMERLRAWLDRIALAGQDEDIPDGGLVTLMTVHNAKGLEYPVVYVVHMMEGQFPHSRSIDKPEDVEEERRLAYVAFTRAMKRLVVTRSRQQPQMVEKGGQPGQRKPAAPSRFLFGLPPEACEGDLPEGDPASADDEAATTLEPAEQRKLHVYLKHRQEATRVEGHHTLVDIEDPEDLRVGSRVHVPERGIGVVRGRSGRGALMVSFDGRPPVPVPLRGTGIQWVRD